MKEIALVVISAFTLVICKGQRMMEDSYINHMKTEISLKIGEAHFDESTIVKGERVTGNFFLHDAWSPGTIVLKDGRVYTNYMLKFDVYHQILYFFNGTDSLEVADEIKEFLISTPDKEMHFLNVSIQKKGKRLYYELLSEEGKGLLLKSCEKVVSTDNKALVDVSEVKYLTVKNNFFWYNKSLKKVIEITPGGSNVKSVIGLPADKQINLSRYDFDKEKDLVAFFKFYGN